MFPIIPILAAAAIVGGITTLAWYSKLSQEKKDHANRVAMQWFHKSFKQLSEQQQAKVRAKVDKDFS